MRYLLFSGLLLVAFSVYSFFKPPAQIEISSFEAPADITSSTVPITTSTELATGFSTNTPTSMTSAPEATTTTSTIIAAQASNDKPAVRSAVSNKTPFQGDTVVVSIFDATLVPKSASFDGKTISFFPYQNYIISLLPISADKALGTYFLDIVFQNGETMKRAIRVQKKSFPLVVLGIPEELGMTSGQLVTNLQTEKTQLMKVLGVTAPETFFSDAFIAPLDITPRVTSEFGELRQTGENQIRHLGVDLAAPLGTPVRAMNGGVVRDAYADTIYGNSIIFDHGQGIFSLYMHLNSMNVKKGDKVSRGDVIGAVGKTGYATAEHLHLSFKINSVSVDPLRFIEAFR